MSTSIVDYYQARAAEFEAVYAKPERQPGLQVLRQWLAEQTRGATLLEIACGTGYWTSVAAAAARAIVATDFNPGPLDIARAKGLGPHVRFAQADAFALPDYGPTFDVGMAHFWWSHVSVADQARFLGHFASKLRPGARLLMIDNNFVAGSMSPISRSDSLGNTYQERSLADGSRYEIIKNFPTTVELERALAQFCSGIDVLQLKHYWAVAGVLA